MIDLSRLTAVIELGDRVSAVRLTREATNDGLAPQAILDATTLAMQRVGERFQDKQAVPIVTTGASS